MMTLQELFDDLAYGELSNVKIGNSIAETLEEKQYPKIISAINQGLVKIYQRLNLRQGKVNLHQHAAITKYYLRSEHAEEADQMDDEFYLEQTEDEPFQDDVIKVLSAVDSDGDKVRVNNPNYPADIFTPGFDTIEIAAPSTTLFNVDGVYRSAVDVFTITYQAKYPKIILTQNMAPASYKLQIPDFIEEPLQIYVAYKLFRKPIKIAKGEVNPSTTLLVEFENSLRQIEALKLAPEESTERDQLTKNGWV